MLTPLKVEDPVLLGHYEHLVEIEIEPPVIDLARYVETARKLPERRGDEQPNAIDVRAIGCNTPILLSNDRREHLFGDTERLTRILAAPPGDLVREGVGDSNHAKAVRNAVEHFVRSARVGLNEIDQSLRGCRRIAHVMPVAEVHEHVKRAQQCSSLFGHFHDTLMESRDFVGRMSRAMLRPLKKLRHFDPDSVSAIKKQKIRSLVLDDVARRKPWIELSSRLDECAFFRFVH